MKQESPWKNCFLGTDSTMKTSCGVRKRIFFNNGATPLVARVVQQTVEELFPCFTYMNESNYNSKYITEQYAKVRDTIADFVGADVQRDMIIFTRTATEALNMMAGIVQQLEPAEIVLSTCMEHMANYLPFKFRMETELIRLNEDGMLDLDYYESLLKKYAGKVKLVTVTAASNLTGYVTPYREMARIAHRYGAKILVDAVQMVPHKPFTMGDFDADDHIDYIVFTAHKCYTGLGGAALIGPKEVLESDIQPMLLGAGVCKYTDQKRIILDQAPVRFEAGYPDIAGVTCFGKILEFMKQCDMQKIAAYEHQLREYLVIGLEQIDGVRIYGPKGHHETIPFVAFSIRGMTYQQIGQILGYDYGIAVAAGVSGADIYAGILLGKTDEELYELYRSGKGYGIVRVSMGMFNSKYEVEKFVSVIEDLSFAC